MISKTVIDRGGKYKCSLFKRHLKLRHKQLKTVTYIGSVCACARYSVMSNSLLSHGP